MWSLMLSFMPLEDLNTGNNFSSTITFFWFEGLLAIRLSLLFTEKDPKPLISNLSSLERVSEMNPRTEETHEFMSSAENRLFFFF